MKNISFDFRHDCGVALQATSRGTGGSVAVIGESAADGVQLVVKAAEAVMSGLCILVFILVMRQIHRIYCSGAGDL